MSVVEHRFGPYGGQYVPETLMPALTSWRRAGRRPARTPSFRAELDALLRDYAGRPTPLYLARRLSEAAGHPVYLKREDLLHTGAHKLNNALGQCLLARRMGKTRIIAETGAGQHGVATATACALLGLECVVYMGTEDIRRQQPNVQRMNLLGATVAPVDAGARTLKEAVAQAIRDWVANVAEHPLRDRLGGGPGALPRARARPAARDRRRGARADPGRARGGCPQRVIACVGGGSNAIGMFTAFVDDPRGGAGGRRGGGRGAPVRPPRRAADRRRPGRGAARRAVGGAAGRARARSLEAHSISAGLDYPGSGPEHACLRDTGRARYVAVNDDEAVAAFRRVARLEGIIPALEPAHALAWLLANPGSELDLVCLRAAATRTWPRCWPTDPSDTGRSASPPAFAASGKRAALMPYLMGGYPDAAASLAHRSRPACEAGADLLELGVPVLRPAGRRAGDPRGGHGGAGGGGHARRRAGPGGCAGHAVPVVVMCYAQPDPGPGRGALRRRAGRRPG